METIQKRSHETSVQNRYKKLCIKIDSHNFFYRKVGRAIYKKNGNFIVHQKSIRNMGSLIIFSSNVCYEDILIYVEEQRDNHVN